MAETDSDARLQLIVAGKTFDVDISRDFNAIDARMFRDQTGFGFTEGLQRLMDPDVLATFVWLYRRKANKRLRWEEVAERVTFADVQATTENVEDDVVEIEPVSEDDPS